MAVRVGGFDLQHCRAALRPGLERAARVRGDAMRELSLHILDLIENSVRAGASMILITLVEDEEKDILKE